MPVPAAITAARATYFAACERAWATYRRDLASGNVPREAEALRIHYITEAREDYRDALAARALTALHDAEDAAIADAAAQAEAEDRIADGLDP